MKTLLVLWTLILLNYASLYRFDYEYSVQAGGWLKYHVIPATWDEARLRCQAEGAVLASPLSRELKSAIMRFTMKQRFAYLDDEMTIFSGVHATFSNGDYSSIEGVPLLRLAISWAPGEPDNDDNSERCLAMTSNGDMADVRCTKVLPYVCYKKLTQIAINECGTIDPEYKLDTRTGSCYKFHRSGLVWSEAYMTCMAEGGYLAVINDDKEAAVVKEIFAQHPRTTIISNNTVSLCIGFHDWGHYGTSFMTIHGEPLEAVYHTWSYGQPNNLTHDHTGHQGESCGSVDRNAKLNDFWCGVQTAFLCEKDPKSLL